MEFQSYKATNLGYDIVCESVNSDQEEKGRDLLNGNRIINLKNLITNIGTFLICKECTQERELQIKLEEKRDQEDFVDYLEAYSWLTLSDEQKLLMEMHEEFNKKTYNP